MRRRWENEHGDILTFKYVLITAVAEGSFIPLGI